MCVFFLSSCSAQGRLLLSLLLEFASVPLPAAPAVFPHVSCCRLPLGAYATFLAPVACPAPAVELCLLGLRCLWCDAWFSTLCCALPPGPAVLRCFPCRRLPFKVSALNFSLTRMPDLLLRWWRRLGCNPSLVFSVLLLHRRACRGLLGSAPCVRELP